MGKGAAYQPLDVYRFFKKEGVERIQFTPTIERLPDAEIQERGLWLPPPTRLDQGELDAQVTSWTVEPEKYGDFLIAIYEEWVRHDVRKIFVMNFEWALNNLWIGNPSPLCIFSRQEGRGAGAAGHGQPIREEKETRMSTRHVRRAAAVLALGVLALSATCATEVRAQAPMVDPAAAQIFKRMTDYLSGLQQFGVHTQNTIEDLLDSGERVSFDVSARVIVSRPNKLRAEREGGLLDQVFYYDGKTLTLYDPAANAYATEPAPGTIEQTLDLARESLGLVVPVADLVYRNAFQLLMQDVTVAAVVGKAVVGGVRCDHVLFSRPGVDFQVWIADGDKPLPRKYVVIDTATPTLLSVSTIMSDWNVAPAVADDRFTFAPPQGVKKIAFMRMK